MSSVADRVRAHRARVAAGRILLVLEVDELPLVEALVAARLLDLSVADSREAITAATARLLEVVIGE
jgi:hypothetical protein